MQPSQPTQCTHPQENIKETKTNATCTAAGSVVKTCTKCNVTLSTTPISATGHNFDDITKPTCANNGCAEPNPNYSASSGDTENDATTGDTTVQQPGASDNSQTPEPGAV